MTYHLAFYEEPEVKEVKLRNEKDVVQGGKTHDASHWVYIPRSAELKPRVRLGAYWFDLIYIHKTADVPDDLKWALKCTLTLAMRADRISQYLLPELEQEIYFEVPVERTPGANEHDLFKMNVRKIIEVRDEDGWHYTIIGSGACHTWHGRPEWFQFYVEDAARGESNDSLESSRRIRTR